MEKIERNTNRSIIALNITFIIVIIVLVFAIFKIYSKLEVEVKLNSEYEEKIERGKRGGRPAKLNPRIVWKLAREGKKAKEISEELGGVPLTTIYSSEGWKQRHLSDFYEKD